MIGLSQLVHPMSEHKISRLVVVDNENKPIGVITLTDATMLSDLLPPFIESLKLLFLHIGILYYTYT